MKLAVITLSELGAAVAATIAAHLDCTLFVHEQVAAMPEAQRFSRVIVLTGEIFGDYDGLVYIMPTGVVSRAIGGQAQSKYRDPAVLVLDVHARWVISLLSGHEGGANRLAMQIANIVDAEPIITTTTEAERRLIVGIGCRRGKPADEIRTAVEAALAMVGRSIDEVRLLTTADVKRDEVGILETAEQYGIALRIIDSESIRSCAQAVDESDFVKEKVNLPAVAEPAALLAGRRTRLLLPKTAFNGITIAIAEERSLP